MTLRFLQHDIDEKGVAPVPRNPVVNPNEKLYQAPADVYPNASIYAKAVGNGHASHGLPLPITAGI